MDAESFFLSPLLTCVEPGEMLREVRFPAATAHARHVFLEVGNRAHGFAVAGIAASVEIDGQRRCARARLALMGMGPTTVRLRTVEDLLAGQALDETRLEHAAEAARGCLEPDGDLHGSASYRRHLAGVLVRRALEQARDEA